MDEAAIERNFAKSLVADTVKMVANTKKSASISGNHLLSSQADHYLTKVMEAVTLFYPELGRHKNVISIRPS